jgi:hypothetical protein
MWYSWRSLTLMIIPIHCKFTFPEMSEEVTCQTSTAICTATSSRSSGGRVVWMGRSRLMARSKTPLGGIRFRSLVTQRRLSGSWRITRGLGCSTAIWRCDPPSFFLDPTDLSLQWHLESGLAVTFVEAPTEMQALIRPSAYVVEQCAMLGFPTSGNAAGLHDLTDLSGLPLGPYRQVLGWRPKAIAALSGCVVAALSGMTSVGLYAFGFGVKRRETPR